MSKLEQYRHLIAIFKSIHKIEKSLPTFMEISRYPHFENVCSNILNFYFDTTQPHNLNDLVLKYLLECTSFPVENYPELVTQNCTREYCTPDNKRIDLVIEGDDFVIAIENKIFHILNNDLQVYQKTIVDKYHNNKHKIFIVLSIKREITSGSFLNITYDDFFKRLKQNIGQYAVNANNQYLTYLLDFIKTIENHYKMEITNREMFDFIISNEDTINDINGQRNILDNQLKKLVWQVSENLKPRLHTVNTSIYGKDTIVFETTLETFIVTVDVVIEFQCIYSELFIRDKSKCYENLDQLDVVKKNTFSKSIRGYELFNEKINFFEINQEEVAKKIYDLLIQIKN